ncbi:hypothetical protein JTE90_013502 [Oedothorax gibbosus]|uniref:Glutamate-rich WD repeat-containing protein 1 n=1 Tax=Oedothorax gibbosus TaxID=931172 RepID=A0AAV6VMW4_9ARAC|nr:hypothetical protein JTE90_013502 [Oedothorax gibbosus]
MAIDEVSEIISSDEEENDESEDDEEEEMEAEEIEEVEPAEGAEENSTTRVYLPQAGEDQENLECDESAYICYHVIKTGSPCLSFDILCDDLGEDRADQFPLTMTVVAGTEVKRVTGNQVLVMKLANMQKNKKKEEKDEDSEESDSESEDEDEKPVLTCAPIKHSGGVNRLKVTTLGSYQFAASWSELGKVHLWDLSPQLEALNDPRAMAAYVQAGSGSVQPEFTFTGHAHEGFAMQWSPLTSGMLATGDINKNIYLWKPMEGGTWNVDKRPFTGHTASVEDIQWSPTESNVLASCSADRSIRIWDMRAAPNKACMLTKNDAHESDVNVIGWNKTDPFILSGGDDGKLRVWDLRQFPDSSPICTFKYHTAPITSVEWHPTDHSVFAASSEDHSVSQWDLAVERDDTEEEGSETKDLPPQLLFLHLGQQEVKEVHWHAQMPGVMASASIAGLNVFRTVSV